MGNDCKTPENNYEHEYTKMRQLQHKESVEAFQNS